MPKTRPPKELNIQRRPGPLVRAIAQLGVSIRTKLLIAFLGITVSMIGLSLFGLLALQQANARTKQLLHDQERIAIYTELDSSMGFNTMMAFASSDFGQRKSQEAGITWLKNPADALAGGLDNLEIFLSQSVRRFGGPESPDGERLIKLRNELRRLHPLARKIRELRRTNNLSAVKALVHGDFAPIALRLQRDAYTIKRQIEGEMAQRAKLSADAFETSQMRVIAISLTAIGVALLLAYAISSSVIMPVGRITRALGTVAQGKFDARASVPNKDEFGDLAQNVNSMTVKLGGLYNEVETQRAELAGWNTELEKKVALQVDEIERTNRLRRFLPAQVADMIVSAGKETELLGSRRGTVAVLFADLRGFTAFSNSVPPEQVISALNTFHATVGPLIEVQGGTLERFLGDGLLVLFNAPAPCDEPAEKALALAADMQASFPPAMREFQTGRSSLGLGIGIATGEATLGQIGFEGRFDYAAIGTAPNLAARLCDQATDGQILICTTTAQQISFSVHEVGPFELKGIPNPVSAFELI